MSCGVFWKKDENVTLSGVCSATNLTFETAQELPFEYQKVFGGFEMCSGGVWFYMDGTDTTIFQGNPLMLFNAIEDLGGSPVAWSTDPIVKSYYSPTSTKPTELSGYTLDVSTSLNRYRTVMYNSARHYMFHVLPGTNVQGVSGSLDITARCPHEGELASITINGFGVDYEAAVNALSPVAYWRLGEAAGTTATDETGSYNGTYVGAPALGEASLYGDTDTAVKFAAGEYVDIALTTTADWSVAFFIKLDSSSGYSSLFQTNGASYQPLYVWNSSIRFNATLTSSALTLGTVYHVVVTVKDTTEEVIIYINGVEDVSGTGNTVLSSYDIARIAESHPTEPLYATLDEFSYHTAILTPTEALELFYASGL